MQGRSKERNAEAGRYPAERLLPPGGRLCSGIHALKSTYQDVLHGLRVSDRSRLRRQYEKQALARLASVGDHRDSVAVSVPAWPSPSTVVSHLGQPTLSLLPRDRGGGLRAFRATNPNLRAVPSSSGAGPGLRLTT